MFDSENILWKWKYDMGEHKMEQLKNEQFNILIVEDDKEIRDGIEIFLKSQGYQVYKAADGVEGLQVIERETIHLAIVDIMMPRMDGDIFLVHKLRNEIIEKKQTLRKFMLNAEWDFLCRLPIL